MKANDESLTADVKGVNGPVTIVLLTRSGDGKQYNRCWLLKLNMSYCMFSAPADLDLRVQSHNERFAEPRRFYFFAQKTISGALSVSDML